MKHATTAVVKNSKLLFEAGQKTAGQKLQNLGKQTIGEVNTVVKGSIATGKLAVKGAVVFGAVAGAKEGTTRVINYAQGKTGSPSIFSLEDCNNQEQELDSQTHISQQMQSFKTTTENTIGNLGKRTEEYYNEYDEQKVDKAISKIPVASGVVAGVSKITGSKEVAAASATAVDLLFASGPVAIASIVQNGVEKATEEAVFTAGKLVINTYRQQIEQSQNLAKMKEKLHPNPTVHSPKKVHSPPTTPKVKQKNTSTKGNQLMGL